MVILKFRGQNSCEETILVPSERFENFIFSSWFSCGPNAKLFTNITLDKEKLKLNRELTTDVLINNKSLCSPKLHLCKNFLTTYSLHTYVAEVRMEVNSGSRKSPLCSSNSP